MAPLLALLTILFGGDAPANAEPLPSAPIVEAERPSVEAEVVLDDFAPGDFEWSIHQPEDSPPLRTQRWLGSIDVPGQKIDFVVTITERAGKLKGLLDIPAQGLAEGELTGLAHDRNELRFHFEIPNLPEAHWPRWTFTVSDTGDSAVGTLSQSGGQFPARLTLDETGEAEVLRRPQHPKRPFPYREVEVTIDAGEHTLAGTLTLPSEDEFGAGPYPGVVLITGSGPQDRDSALMGHKPFFVLSDHLARRGIAAVRFDERGVGASTGSFEGATTLDFAKDARAWADWLAAHEAIRRVGLIGHSEGGLIAPFVANGNDEIDFVVLLAGPGVPGREVLGVQLKAILQAGGIADEENLDAQVAAQQAAFDAIARNDEAGAREALRRLTLLQVAAGGAPEPEAAALDEQIGAQLAQLNAPWFRTFLSLDPRPELAAMTQPVLALNGSLDTQVLTDQNLAEIERVFAEAGKSDKLTALELEGLNHLFQPATTGGLQEYAQIETTFDESALERIAEWILKNAR